MGVVIKEKINVPTGSHDNQPGEAIIEVSPCLTSFSKGNFFRFFSLFVIICKRFLHTLKMATKCSKYNARIRSKMFLIRDCTVYVIYHC